MTKAPHLITLTKADLDLDREDPEMDAAVQVMAKREDKRILRDLMKRYLWKVIRKSKP